jgi:hypothetical protein
VENDIDVVARNVIQASASYVRANTVLMHQPSPSLAVITTDTLQISRSYTLADYNSVPLIEITNAAIPSEALEPADCTIRLLPSDGICLQLITLPDEVYCVR